MIAFSSTFPHCATLSSNEFCSRCDPVVCDITDHHGSFQSMTSYGKKKRKKRSAKHEDVDPKEDDVMVAGVIHISDQFELNDKQDDNKESSKDSSTEWFDEKITCKQNDYEQEDQRFAKHSVEISRFFCHSDFP